jgi:hypothetical protein
MTDCLLIATCERPNTPLIGAHVIPEMTLLLWSLSANLDQFRRGQDLCAYCKVMSRDLWIFQDKAVYKTLLNLVGVSEQLHLLNMVDTVR